MGKENVVRWIKKPETVWISPKTETDTFEMDELFWFLQKKSNTETNVFFRNIETLRAVIGYFVEAYNKYGEAKEKYRKEVRHTSKPKNLHKYREVPFGFLIFYNKRKRHALRKQTRKENARRK